MREVDEALARAYAQRDKADPAQTVPPAPHWPAHASQRSWPTSEPGTNPLDAPIPTQLSGDSSRRSIAREVALEPLNELQWPSVVLTLEKEWGDRFERMADFLVECRQRQNIRVILFTSCHRAEGRSTLVLTLARALSRHSCRTVLVDADLTGPMIARLLGLRPQVGLDDVVEGGQSLSDALIDAPDDHLTILPMRMPLPDLATSWQARPGRARWLDSAASST